jgi:TATA-binding protein-associated factor Taf7
LEDWFAPILWDIDQEDEQTRELAGRIHILVSELSRGDRTLHSFRQEMMSAIRPLAENRYGDPSILNVMPESIASAAMNAAA